MANQPLLSIGIIFKNEIRSLERCLKALQPLRDAVPCELIMADTGSGDGSREIAARYADILFDFPWRDDFAAARNAVMDRASGVWFLTVDADEYLGPDVSELTDFLENSRQESAGLVVVRNYTTYDMDGEYNDFAAFRLLRMSTGYRYRGAVHESLEPAQGGASNLEGRSLSKTILHHDGYVGLMEEQGKAKRERNLRLLREALAETPDDLRRLQQYIESGMNEPDCLDKILHAAELIEERRPGWEKYGPPIFRYAVAYAAIRGLPETDAWIRRAEEWFPDSYYTLIDVSSLAFGECWNRRQDYGACVQYGERYLAACARYDADGEKMFTLTQGSVAKASQADQQNMKVFLSAAYLRERRPEKALALMESVRFTLMDQQMTGILTNNLVEIQESCTLDTAPLVTAAWEGLTAPEPSQERADERRAVFYNNAVPVFSADYRDVKAFDIHCRRPAYTAFLPLKGKCALGTAAAILESRDSREAAELLGEITQWRELPHAAILHAVRLGAAFPPPDRPVYLEELDELAIRAAREPEAAAELLERALEAAQDLQGASWARALAMASLLACTWEDEAEGMALARRFAEAEAAFLSRCYGPEALTPEGLSQLPSMHRFGWYCVQAFEALDNKDPAGYARLLRRGLEVCESAKPVAKFLLEHTLQRPDPELLALAEQVRTMLAAYPADDPAVAALKASPAYQEVAHLIEGEQK